MNKCCGKCLYWHKFPKPEGMHPIYGRCRAPIPEWAAFALEQSDERGDVPMDHTEFDDGYACRIFISAKG